MDELFPLIKHFKQQHIVESCEVQRCSKNLKQIATTSWNQKNSGKKLFSRSDKTEEVVENGERKSIKKIKLDWDLFRDALANRDLNLTKSLVR